ncbi:MAG TPA: hypothetical protein VEC57_00040 [Candidatus Limnocylindrales bacterium]|nr:hypothetical protein [Candidatus Limnocylindrales bacterium]
MPYAPGVQDISGQLLGRGISDLGAGIGRFIEARQRRNEQNNVFLSKAKATESFIKNNPEKFGGEESVKQFLSVDPKESPEARYNRLQGALENTILQTKLQEQQQQAQMRQLEIQRAQQQQAQLERLRQFQQMSQGVGRGVYAPQVQDRMQQQMAQNPFMAQAAQLAQATGQAPAPETLAQIQAQKEIAAAKPKDTMVLERVRQSGPRGEPIEVTYDATTGKKFAEGPVSQTPRPYPSAEEAAEKAYKEERSKAMAAMVQEVIGKAQQYQETLDQTSRARALLEQDTKQGRGETTVRALQQAINFLVPGDKPVFDTSKSETLQTAYADMAVTAAARLKGQGQITQPERELLANTVAKFTDSAKGASYIMDFMDAVARREIARGEYFADIEASDRAVTAKDNQQFYRDNPISKFLKSDLKQTGEESKTVDDILKKYR